MSNKFKEIDLKNRTYYFFDDMIYTKNLDPNKIKIDKIYIKIFLFTTLDTCRSKNIATQKLIV